MYTLVKNFGFIPTGNLNVKVYVRERDSHTGKTGVWGGIMMIKSENVLCIVYICT